MAAGRNRQFSHRWATDADIPAITTIMDAAITGHQRNFLTPEQIMASREVMGLDTRPGWTRRGIGRLIIALCEEAARSAGFSRTQSMATLSGEPLYLASGYRPIECVEVETSMCVFVPLIRMEKTI